jgi:hypothetical protein
MTWASLAPVILGLLTTYSLLRLQLPLLRRNKRPDVIGQIQARGPRLVLQGNRETRHPVDRARSLLVAGNLPPLHGETVLNDTLANAIPNREIQERYCSV